MKLSARRLLALALTALPLTLTAATPASPSFAEDAAVVAFARDLEQRAREIPPELLIKAQTLGASTWTLILRVILPQLLPRLLIALRLVLGSAWLFLIAAEAIASTDGLGYRIFLMRRYLSMDVILPYVAWITFLAFFLDFLLRGLRRVSFGWMYRGHM